MKPLRWGVSPFRQNTTSDTREQPIGDGGWSFGFARLEQRG
jgi:hypothetical protein